MSKFYSFRWLFIIGLISLLPGLMQAQQAAPLTALEPNQFDYGKMWTFEYAPIKYFTDTYGFKPDEKWMEHARMAALRFSSYCSASFISPNGLVMTNHHCSRGEVGKVMKEGEDFDKTGFYATKQEEERQVPGLYVKQLVKMADVTDMVTKLMATAQNDGQLVALRDSALKMAKNQYGSKADWQGLELETVSYYNGGRFSVYGYKRYDDIRLVWIPELQMGFFGGDPDNFTYPRYNLDCTLWRVYDNGKPLNSSAFYFKFNPDGIKDNEPVFVIGNPGSTERYRTVAQLEYDRDYRYKIQLEWMRNRIAILQAEYDKNPSHDLQEEIFGFSNGEKAISGFVAGMHDPQLMGRKLGMENKVKAQSKNYASGQDYWGEIAKEYKALSPYASEVTLLPPNPYNGKALVLMHYTEAYIEALEGGAGEADLSALREQIKTNAQGLNDEKEVILLGTLYKELKKFADPNDKYVDEVLGGKTPEEAAKALLSTTAFADGKKLDMLLQEKPDQLRNSKDPLLAAANAILPAYNEAVDHFRGSTPKRRALETKVGREVYEVFGLSIPPDATFTLRISDGVVKSYNYNGTTAPIYTTYYGMYDRYYSHKGAFPWSLPDRWMNPPAELLKAPLNMVSTNDIIGGNSGSPMINRNGEAVGLIFDGNVESLPGNFIYDTKANRTVSVHAGGIAAALKYIYHADRLLSELNIK